MSKIVFDPSRPKVFYLAPDYSKPSWGIGLLYHHVRMLLGSGIDASIVHNKKPFRLSWLGIDVPVVYLDSSSFRPRQQDILVIPEIIAGRRDVCAIVCRRIVFVQGSFLILAKMERAYTYKELGYEQAITILPHAREIVEKYYGVPAAIIPPYVAPYFFLKPQEIKEKPRAKEVVLYPKPGVEDYDILIKLLRRQNDLRWKLTELKDLPHHEVAQIMQKAAFFINLNSREAFNTTVPEAMAAGCIPICYDAYGGMDFLRDGENAFVFPNHHIYPLIDKLFDLIENFDLMQKRLLEIRADAYATACQYTEDNMKKELMRFYRFIYE